MIKRPKSIQVQFWIPTLVVWVLASALLWSNLHQSLESKVLDWRFRMRGSIATDPSLVIVDISDDAVEEFGSWPFPRHLHGMFIDAVTNLGAKAVVYDVFFSQTTDPRSDQFFVEMASEAGQVYFPLRLSPYPESIPLDSLKLPAIWNLRVADLTPKPEIPNMLGFLSLPLPGLDTAAAAMGFVNLFPDQDGTVRRSPLHLSCGGAVFPQLVLPVSMKNALQQVPLDHQGNMIINWPGTWAELPHYSFREILVSYKQLMEGLDPLLPIDSLRGLKDKILIVGRVEKTAQDFFENPLESRHPTTGFQFAMLNTLMQGNAIRVLDLFTTILLLLLFLLLLGLILQGDHILWQVLGALLLIPLFIVQQLAFEKIHLWIPWVVPAMASTVLIGWVNVTKSLDERRIKKQVKSTFARYVTEEVMEQLLEKPELTQLGGRKEIVSILFSDIRGFTSLSETREPKEVVDQLNEYLSVMTPIIFANKGIIDKFVGDEIMAYFGAPVVPEDHAFRAVKTALEMQQALVPLRTDWAKRGLPDIQIGIGINTGPVIMGNIGSAQYMDFTLIGDAVNLGARLCSLAAAGETLVSSSTYREVESRVEIKNSKECAVKGKAKPVWVYSLSHIMDKS